MAKEFSFPRGFLWGAATSSHQVEGGSHNDWSEWERKNAKLKAQSATLRQAHGKEWPDYLLQRYPNPLQEENYISGKACYHYHRFREDFDIAKSLGHNAHRFSIEWSRIEPEEGKFNEKEIEHYREVISALRERAMEPFVTLWHWTLPVWLAERDGWGSPDAVACFERFVAKIAQEFCGNVRYWCVLNEPVVYTSYSYIIGVRPPQQKSMWQAMRVFHYLAKAHRRAYRVLHRVADAQNQKCFVGIAKHNKWFIPGTRSPLNRTLAVLARILWNNAFMWHIRGCQDYIGLNYYNADRIMFDRKRQYHGLYELKESAEGFYHELCALKTFHKPIYVLENGLDDPTDARRAGFIKDHLEQLVRARREGADIRGYFHWSLLDNFEWEKGFWPRFGLVEINYQTLERKIRPSAREYKKIIDANAIAL